MTINNQVFVSLCLIAYTYSRCCVPKYPANNITVCHHLKISPVTVRLNRLKESKHHYLQFFQDLNTIYVHRYGDNLSNQSKYILRTVSYCCRIS